MPVLDEEKACFQKWSRLIKDDRISEVLAEALERNISGENALECVVYISQLAYKDAQNGVPFNSLPEDIIRLTEILCPSVISQPSLCNLRFISSLYHIAFLFFKKNQTACLKQLYKIILETKQANISIFLGEGNKVYANFILLLKKVIPKITLNEDSLFDLSGAKELFSLFLDLLVEENEVKNGSTFLETVLYSSNIVAKQSKKSAVILISKGLQLFFEVKKIKDVNSSLVLVFKLYSSLFLYQLEVTGYASALGLVLSYLDSDKWKFGEENILHGECFYFLCQVKMCTSSQSENSVRKCLKNANVMLEQFKNTKTQEGFVKEACLLMISLVSNLKESKTLDSSVLFDSCLEPFLEMLLNFFDVIKGLKVDMTYYLHCLCNMFLIVTELGLTKKHILKDCFKIILQTEALMLEVNRTLKSENDPKSDCYIKFVLCRCANLIRSYHLASLQEEIITFSTPLCRYICSLPCNIFDDVPSQNSMELSFTCLMQALGPKQLYKVLEIAVAWMIVCPQSSDKIFRVWGDLKHNAICAEQSNHLETTIYTIITEGKTSLEENWLPCNLSTSRLIDYLVKELEIYFTNSTLRGPPLLAAAKALESLEMNLVTQVRVVVAALDLTTARSEYAEQCCHYYDRSKQLVSMLRKKKNEIDFVDFNTCMGELLYAQFRCKLKKFRFKCEGEVLRLSALRESTGPLIAELPEDRLDPDDTCNVTTRYANLSLDKQQEVMAELDTAVVHWRKVCTRLTEKELLRSMMTYDLKITLKNLQEAAFIMKLYCDEIKEGELWQLLYNLALLVDDKDKIVTAVGELLKTKNLDPAAAHKAQEILKKSELSERTKYAFVLNKALWHLRKYEIADGVKVLKAGTEMKKSISTILFVSCNIIVGLYQKLGSWKRYADNFSHGPSCHFNFHKALSHLLYLTQEEKWNSLVEASHIQLRLLQVSHQLGKVNLDLELPREARCYLKSQLALAQKLGLPLRAAELLLVLAWVDLNTGMMADCAVKLEGLEALLNLQGTSAKYVAGSDSSIKLSKEEVWKPEFLEHRAGCDCFVCRCTDYQRLVLDTLTLRAVFCANHDNLPLALQSFRVAFQVQDHLSKSDDTEVQETSARMWKHYADTLALSNKVKDGLNVSKKAWNSLPSIQQAPITVQKILHQKSGLQSMLTHHSKLLKPRIVIEPEENTCVVKTPGSKQGKILPLSTKPTTPLSVVSGNITPKFVRPVRKFTIPSSGEENTPPPPKSPPKSKRRTKLPAKFKLETPQTGEKQLKGVKTPFKVFDDDDVAVSASSSKVDLRAKKTTSKSTVVNQVHKQLFSSSRISADKTSDVPDFKSPERKSSRKPKAWASEKSILGKDDKGSKKTESYINQSSQKKELQTESGVFSFDELKQEVNIIKRTIPKATYGKSSSTLKANKEKVTMSVSAGPGAGEIDSDCSIVESTPTPPQTRKMATRKLIPRRATRSNKT